MTGKTGPLHPPLDKITRITPIIYCPAAPYLLARRIQIIHSDVARKVSPSQGTGEQIALARCCFRDLLLKVSQCGPLIACENSPA